MISDNGLRFAPVEHTGNQNESPEEVERVAASVSDSLRTGATWTDENGETHPLGLRDIQRHEKESIFARLKWTKIGPACFESQL